MSSAPQPGTILAGKYRVEQILGVGGMGAVVAAHHLRLDQKVAIKYLLPEAIKNPEVLERFGREARAAAKIRSEHVARVIDVGQFDDGAPYIIMEYLEGHDLAKELATKAPLRVEDVARYLLETCEALAEAHAAKIVHRDLKPQNLFLAKHPGERSIIKVLDFGISKVGTDAASLALTKTSALMGTAFYMSPEQMTTPKAVDHRSDIWSLGVILYELLAGQPPFLGESVAEIIAGILTNEPVSLRRHRPEVPQGFADVIATCMQSKPADRYASVAMLAAAVAPFAAPSDRASIEITARVLGESVRPAGKPTAEPMTETVATATLSRTPQRTPPAGFVDGSGRSPDVPASFARTEALPSSLPTPASAVGSPLGVAPVTTHALSRSGNILDAPKSRAPILVAAVAGLILLGGGALALKRYVQVDPKPTGLVSASASEKSDPTIVLSPTPTSEATSAVRPAAIEEPPVHPAGALARSARPAPSGPTVTRPATAGASASAIAAAPTTSAVPSATPPVAASSSASKNPLQMGIK